jgi:hypothetical protein
MMRNTKAFQQAVTDTTAHLNRLGVTGVGPAAIADTIERNITAVSRQLKIKPASAFRYFDAADFAQSIATMAREAEDSYGEGPGIGQPPLPPKHNPEMALLLARFFDSLEECDGNLFAVVVGLIVNAWQAGHIHGEDGCAGCDFRGPGGHDYTQRMARLRRDLPDYTKWFDPGVFNARLAEAGYELKQRAEAGRRME